MIDQKLFIFYFNDAFAGNIQLAALGFNCLNLVLSFFLSFVSPCTSYHKK